MAWNELWLIVNSYITMRMQSTFVYHFDECVATWIMTRSTMVIIHVIKRPTWMRHYREKGLLLNKLQDQCLWYVSGNENKWCAVQDWNKETGVMYADWCVAIRETESPYWSRAYSGWSSRGPTALLVLHQQPQHSHLQKRRLQGRKKKIWWLKFKRRLHSKLQFQQVEF